MQTCSRSDVRRSWHTDLLEFDDVAAIRPRPGTAVRSLDMNGLTAAKAFPFAWHLVAWVKDLRGGELRAWIFESGIWDASENPHLYYTWRESKHDFSTLDDRPGHLFLSHERQDCETLAFMAACFGWGLCLISQEATRAAYFDHDGHLALVAMQPAALAEFTWST